MYDMPFDVKFPVYPRLTEGWDWDVAGTKKLKNQTYEMVQQIYWSVDALRLCYCSSFLIRNMIIHVTNDLYITMETFHNARDIAHFKPFSP